METAASIFGDGSRPLATASALEDLGRLLVKVGANDEATTALARALEITVQVGANWDAARVRGRLRRLGVRRRVIASKRPKTGWEALTSAEAAVARLASEGKTDRDIGESLFISPHTVNTHLRHIFDKLGVRSRLALTRAAEARHNRPANCMARRMNANVETVRGGSHAAFIAQPDIAVSLNLKLSRPPGAPSRHRHLTNALDSLANLLPERWWHVAGPTCAKDINPLYREENRSSMRNRSLPWCCPDLRDNSAAILEAIRDGSMRRTGPWRSLKVDRLRPGWIASGIAD